MSVAPFPPVIPATGAVRALKFLTALLRTGAFRRLTATERDVVVAYVIHVDQDGLGWPSVDMLAALTGHDRRHVQRALRRLEKLTLFRPEGYRVRPGIRGHGPMQYRLLLPVTGDGKRVAESATVLGRKRWRIETGKGWRPSPPELPKELGPKDPDPDRTGGAHSRPPGDPPGLVGRPERRPTPLAAPRTLIGGKKDPGQERAASREEHRTAGPAAVRGSGDRTIPTGEGTSAPASPKNLQTMYTLASVVGKVMAEARDRERAQGGQRER